MIITQITSDATELIKGSGLPRSGGVHLTGIISDMALKLGFFKRRKDEDDDDAAKLRMELGFIWEDVLSKVLGDRMADRPDEVELGGIVGSPDGLAFDDDGLVLEEYKATWKSSKKGIDEQWYWLAQMKGYCKMIGCDHAILRVLYINGDYSFNGPEYRVFTIQFTQDELDENWEMILNHKKAMEKSAAIIKLEEERESAGGGGVVDESNDDWGCKT